MNEAVEEFTCESILRQARLLAATHDFDALEADKFPIEDLRTIFAAGFCYAPLPTSFGGAGLGTDPGKHLPLLETLKELGRANLSLARIYEGHVNAIILLFAFGTVEQQRQAADACFEGKLFSVWNTDGARSLRLTLGVDGACELAGEKAFASAAEHAECYLVTADRPEGGRQMLLLESDKSEMTIDKRSWNPLGMQGSASFQAALDNTRVPDSAFIGEPGDYYRAPLFLGGAIRTSAIHLGGAVALLEELRKYCRAIGRTQNALLRRRAALIYASVESGNYWLERAANVAERCLHLHATGPQMDEMNFTANITRVAIEKICSEVIQLVTESAGARGLNHPYRFASLIRDLTMFLRQPDPDGCISEAGRVVLEDLNV